MDGAQRGAAARGVGHGDQHTINFGLLTAMVAWNHGRSVDKGPERSTLAME